MTIEQLRFYGSIRSAFEQLTGAILPSTEANSFLSKLHEDYLASGSPNPAKKWIEHALTTQALSVDRMPVWVESVKHKWPFYAGRPMIYLGLTTVPDTPISREYAAPSVTLLSFGARVQLDGGWSMTYIVIEQHNDL